MSEETLSTISVQSGFWSQILPPTVILDFIGLNDNVVVHINIQYNLTTLTVTVDSTVSPTIYSAGVLDRQIISNIPSTIVY